MALRIRKDGRVLCAAMHPEEPGDTYLDDGLHYRLSAEQKLLVTEPMERHRLRGEWWWSGNVPAGIEIEEFYDHGKTCPESLSSPALAGRSHLYPPNFRGRVPWKIRMACTVRPDLPWLLEKKERGMVAVMDEIYECWVNKHGAVVAILGDGQKLGVKPAEFDVVAWHAQQAGNSSQKETK